MTKKTILIYFAIGLFCFFLVCTAVDYDNDLFARLIVGERIVEAGIFPYHDFLSYTPTHPWYDHEWGSSIIFYTTLKFLKPIGFIILQAFIMFMTIVFVVKTQKLQKHKFPTSIIFLSTFAIIYQHLNASLIRCHIFSFLFFSIVLYILEKYRKKNDKKLIWIIPLIILIWNNLHGGVVAGLGLIFMYIVGIFFEKKEYKQLLYVLLTSLPLLIINPYGIKYLNFLFSATTMQRRYIVEWWPFYKSSLLKYYFLTAAYCIIGYIIPFIKNKKIDITKTIVLTVTLFEGLAHVKLLPLSLITVSAFCYNDFIRLLKFIRKFLKKFEKVLATALIVISLTFIPLLSPTYPRATWEKFPLKEVEFIKINNIKGNLASSFGLGSFVAYKLYPQNFIFIDGRYEEVYNEKEFLTLGAFEMAERGWGNIVYEYGTDILMVNKEWEVYPKMLESTVFKLIYEGNIAGIFIKSNKVKKKYLQPNNDIDYYKKNILIPGTNFSKKTSCNNFDY